MNTNDQQGYSVRCEWGLHGIGALAGACDVFVIVDVLSFSTCVDIAVARGAWVYPWRWQNETAAQFAASVGAVLAGRRSHGQAGYSLSPASLQTIAPATRLVLPSPNGATLSLATQGTPTLAGCLRNARAVAERAQHLGECIGVIAAGERWPDGSLRPGFEDWAGAGAIVAHLRGSRSPEAEWAYQSFRAAQSRLPEALMACSSGRELCEQGFEDDVALAAQIDISDVAPLLADGAYRP
jgi:2-phosphosulfolactate phosphatase